MSFEEVIAILTEGKMFDVIEHPNVKKYPHQQIFIVEIGGYVYGVPFVIKNKNTIFLKTIYPSRKLTKQYLHEVKHEKA